MADIIQRSESFDAQLLKYLLACHQSWSGWWSQSISGTGGMTRRGFFDVCRKRYAARRSVASLDSDIKDKPFPRSSNIGIGAEAVFGEFLIPTFLANTRDLEPPLQVVDKDTDEVDGPRTAFHATYQKRLWNRALWEHSTREMLTVGSAFHKGSYETVWKQAEAKLAIWVNPLTHQPMMQFDPSLGKPMPVLADLHMPEEVRPKDPFTNRPMQIAEIPSVDWRLVREGPTYAVRTVEQVLFPPTATEPDPARWQEGLMDFFEVSPYWFLGRDGDPWEGKLKNLDKLWKAIGIDPNQLYEKPTEALKEKVVVVEFRGPYPVLHSGKPVEIIALFVPAHELLLGWRLTPFPGRGYFNRQVWHRGDLPIGKGIPETIWGLRDALDASVNQDVDSGNIWNHPPVLISDLAMLDDEEYEMTGPGTRWIVRDVNGVRVPFTPPATRNPIERENWLLSMAQRVWGVTDLNLNAPTSSLSPNIGTATAAVAVLNQGSLKFGHLTRRLAETDSQEYQFAHECFRLMLANPITVPFEGNSLVVKPEQRGEFFHERYAVWAIGNGITTNPILRQQIQGQALAITGQHPLVAGDPELQREMLQDFFAAFGLRYKVKPAQVVEQMKIFMELMQTEPGQRLLPMAAQQVIAEMQAQALAQRGNGRPNVTMA